jgi:hypothetical protein
MRIVPDKRNSNNLILQLQDLAKGEMLFDFTVEKDDYGQLRAHMISKLLRHDCEDEIQNFEQLIAHAVSSAENGDASGLIENMEDIAKAWQDIKAMLGIDSWVRFG